MENLKISENKKYLTAGGKPFFWLGDTGWLIFHKLTEDEAYVYLKNRAVKGFNVIQAVLVYATEGLCDINKMYIPNCDVESPDYWAHCDRVIKKAESLGLYMALLPCWGSLLKAGIITEENAGRYAEFLGERYKDYTNIVWVLGGDIRPVGFEKIYDTMGKILKEKNPDRLITFHPFGRCASSTWFNDRDWLDFNMFQSGHRRYDQGSLGRWDDNKRAEGFFGEDNWKYVLRDRERQPLKPTLDAEPSYEWILQGLHDPTQPYWRATHVRRYAYWSVFAGACGHTYGDNAVMQFYGGKDEPTQGVNNYGVIDNWKTSLHHEGSGQMKYLKDLMTSVDFTKGNPRDKLIIGGQREKHERIAVFAGEDFLFAYSWLGNEFELNTAEYIGFDAYWFTPSKGIYSYLGKIKEESFKACPPEVYDEDKDRVLVLRKE
ncbi:MAG: glycoside hydrolase family 140 protein [Clostridiales bacterium]|nr:glycoside hydrolase family 140 protein [Clostridiales bacterium]